MPVTKIVGGLLDLGFLYVLFDNFMRARRRLHYSYLHERWTERVGTVVLESLWF